MDFKEFSNLDLLIYQKADFSELIRLEVLQFTFSKWPRVW